MNTGKRNKLEQLFEEGFLPNFVVPSQIKTALLLQLFSREPIHILLLGDPARGKTSILKEMSHLHDRGRYMESNGYLQMFPESIRRKGCLPGVELLCFNRLDSCSSWDRRALTTLMKNGTAVLAAATPKFGRFDPYGVIVNQIDLDPWLLSHFDLVFPMLDLPHPDKDNRIADIILTRPPDANPPRVPTELLRNLARGRKAKQAEMTRPAIEKLKQYYLSMRDPGTKRSRGRIISITARELETLVKLAKASALVQKSSLVSLEDAEKAIYLMNYYLHQIATDAESGRISLDRLQK